MAQLEIDTAAVDQTAAKVGAATSSTASSSGVTVTAPASDPVSVAVAQTLQARCAAITGYSSLAEAVTQARSSMLSSSATTYDDQEQISSAALASRGGAGLGSVAPPAAAPSLPNVAIPTISAPQIGAPPTNGKEIATLMHGGPGPSGLYAAAQQLRSHASELRSAAHQLQGGSAELSAEWRSKAGEQASSRIQELGQWYERHADHASSAAGALETHAETYARARANTPTPQQFQDTENRLKQAATANANPANMGRYAPVVSALQTELGGLHTKATTQYADYARSAGSSNIIGDPLEAPPRPGDAQALDAPLAPPPKDDPQKYWLDLSKIVQKAPGELGPNGYMELTPGSGTWYPDPKIDNLHPGQFPSGPAKAPLDLSDIKQYAPGALGPNGYQELIPDSGTWVPQPGRFPGVEDAPPQIPIDVRKLIQVPEGTLAPANSMQIAPGLWYPRPPGPR